MKRLGEHKAALNQLVTGVCCVQDEAGQPGDGAGGVRTGGGRPRTLQPAGPHGGQQEQAPAAGEAHQPQHCSLDQPSYLNTFPL